jgi:hypothetical protein
MSVYLKAESADYELSGPQVWPKTTAYETVDRYIFRRPELAYLRALRLIRTGPMSPTFIRIRISREYKNGSRSKVETIGAFVHRVDPDLQPTEDVAAFLRELRQVLYRVLPDRPQPTVSIRLRFFNPHTKKAVTSFQERWL